MARLEELVFADALSPLLPFEGFIPVDDFAFEFMPPVYTVDICCALRREAGRCMGRYFQSDRNNGTAIVRSLLTSDGGAGALGSNRLPVFVAV